MYPNKAVIKRHRRKPTVKVLNSDLESSSVVAVASSSSPNCDDLDIVDLHTAVVIEPASPPQLAQSHDTGTDSVAAHSLGVAAMPELCDVTVSGPVVSDTAAPAVPSNTAAESTNIDTADLLPSVDILPSEQAYPESIPNAEPVKDSSHMDTREESVLSSIQSEDNSTFIDRASQDVSDSPAAPADGSDCSATSNDNLSADVTMGHGGSGLEYMCSGQVQLDLGESAHSTLTEDRTVIEDTTPINGMTTADGITPAGDAIPADDMAVEDIAITRDMTPADDQSTAEGVCTTEETTPMNDMTVGESFTPAGDITLAGDIHPADNITLASDTTLAGDIYPANNITLASDTTLAADGLSVVDDINTAGDTAAAVGVTLAETSLTEDAQHPQRFMKVEIIPLSADELDAVAFEPMQEVVLVNSELPQQDSPEGSEREQMEPAAEVEPGSSIESEPTEIEISDGLSVSHEPTQKELPVTLSGGHSISSRSSKRNRNSNSGQTFLTPEQKAR